MAFAGSGSAGLFAEALDQATIAPSTWRPSEFAAELFLQRFVVHCFRIKLAGREPVMQTQHLYRLLSQPPADPDTVTLHRHVLFELTERPELRAALEAVYLDLCKLRGLLENGGGIRIWDENRRRLDILHVFQSIVDALAQSFAGAESALRRLREFGIAVRRSEPYAALQDLLKCDARLPSVDVRVSIGADGSVNGFHVLAVKENTDNPFVNPVWRRWLAKLELFVRGYRFSDGEVLARLVDAVVSGLELEQRLAEFDARRRQRRCAALREHAAITANGLPTARARSCCECAQPEQWTKPPPSPPEVSAPLIGAAD